MTRSIGIPMDEQDRGAAAAELQRFVVDLVALSLNGKQLHWHVTGENFKPVHELLDEVVTTARDAADEVAERSVTLGVPVDGRPATVGKENEQGELEEGWVEDEDALETFVDIVTGVVTRARAAVKVLEVEPVSQDLVISVLHSLEKHLWMLQAHLVDD